MSTNNRRDLLGQIATVTAATLGSPVDLRGSIGRRVLAGLLPARRPRTSPRVVKRAKRCGKGRRHRT